MRYKGKIIKVIEWASGSTTEKIKEVTGKCIKIHQATNIRDTTYLTIIDNKNVKHSFHGGNVSFNEVSKC